MTTDFFIGLTAGILAWPIVTITLFLIDHVVGCSGNCSQGRRDCDCRGKK